MGPRPRFLFQLYSLCFVLYALKWKKSRDYRVKRGDKNSLLYYLLSILLKFPPEILNPFRHNLLHTRNHAR